MELLAPAGSKESFIAALRGGADAVYTGVGRFNARLNADNLSLYDLEVLNEHARSKNAKVFVTFNTLLKQHEVPEAVKAISRIAAIRPAGLIVQDAGIARIVRDHFPDLPLLASTQMAVHNSYGVAELAKMGFSRAILARELSLSELKLIARKTPLPLEIFVHGALCFSISGMCLFSSYIGAHSGNRGLCTQPCRRRWKSGDREGFLFSPKDLELAGFIPELKKIGIASLKIEGRMRSREYVYRVAKAYRLLIDAKEHEFPQALKEARDILALDWAREKTTFLFHGTDPSLFQPKESQCLGKKIGTVTAAAAGAITFETSLPLQKGDRLRVTDPSQDRTKTFTLNAFTVNEGRCTVTLDEPFKPGAAVYKAGDASWDDKSVDREMDSVFRAYKREHQGKPPLTPVPAGNFHKLIAGQWPKTTAGKPQLWIKIDSPQWLPLLPDKENIRVVLSLTRENIHQFRHALATCPVPPSRLAAELTPYIPQRDLAEYRQAVDAMVASGVTCWIVNNLSHFGFFDPEAGLELVAGSFLYTLNAFAARAYKDRGVTRFAVSWEDELPNIRLLCNSGLSGRLLAWLYGYPALVRSRMLGEKEACKGAVQGGDTQFSLHFESGSCILTPAAPCALFDERGQLSSDGITDLGLDLSFLPPSPKTLNELLRSFDKRENPPRSAKFNFRRGLQ